MTFSQLNCLISGGRTFPILGKSSGTVSSMILDRDWSIQLKFLHRVYYTPQRLANINLNFDPMSTRCTLEPGTFWHMVWSCPKLRPYWEAVTNFLSDLCGMVIPLDSMFLLLSYFVEYRGDRYTKLCLTFTLFYA